MRSIVRILSAAVMAMALPLAMMAHDRKMVHTDASELSVCGKAGDRNLYHLRLSVLGPCNSSTIDGGHFTDEAFRIWAEETYSILKKVCR